MPPSPSRLRAFVLSAIAGLANWLNAVPTITFPQPATVTVPSGQPATFSVQGIGAGEVQVQWRRMGLALSGQTGRSLTIPAATMADAGFYDVVLTDGTGSTTSRPCRLMVAPVGGYPTTLRLDTSFAPLFEGNGGSVSRLAVAPGGAVYVAGSFTSIAGQPRRGLARLTADLQIDPDFIPDIPGAPFNAISVQADGKVLVCGALGVVNGEYISLIARLNLDGSRDRSFAPVLTRAGGYASVSVMVVQPDGKIIIGGRFDSAGGEVRTSLARLNSDGSCDTSFFAALDVGTNVFGLALSGDKVVVLGSFKRIGNVTRDGFARLNSDGSLDPTFVPDRNCRYANSVAASVDGTVYVILPRTETSTDAGIAKLRNDGARDDGYTPALHSGDVPLSLAILPDGRVATSLSTPNGVTYAVFLPDGRKDSGYVFPLNAGRDGRVVAGTADNRVYIGCSVTSVGLSAGGGISCFEANGALGPVTTHALRVPVSPRTVMPVAGGKWLVGGPFDFVNGLARSGLARLNADGTTDTSFDATGTNVGSVVSMVQQGDGRILVITSGQEIAERLLPDGRDDPSFLFNPGTSFGSAIHEERVLPDGRIAVAGWLSTYDGETLNTGVAVILPDGRRDPSFALWAQPLAYIDAFGVAADGGLALAGNFRWNDGYSYSSFVRMDWMGGLVYPLPPDQGPSGVTAIGTDATGRLLLAGSSFSGVSGARRYGFGRMNPDGSLADCCANPVHISSTVSGLTAQTDNKVLVAGSFTWVNGVPCRGLIRLGADDAFDTTFTVSDLTSASSATEMHYTDEGRLLVLDGYGYRDGKSISGLIMLKPEALPPPPVITQQPISHNARVGDLITLSVKATGDVTGYQWEKDGYLISGAVGSKLVLPNIQSESFGSYSVEVSGPGGAVMSETAILGVSGVAGPRYRLLDYFNPLVAGNEWLYARTGDTAARTHTRTVVADLNRAITGYTDGAAATPVPFRSVALFSEYGVSDAGGFTSAEAWTDYFASDGNRLGIYGDDEAGPLAVRFDGALRLPPSMAVGESVVLEDDAYANGVWGGRRTVVFRLLRIVNSYTAAGTFSDCLEIQWVRAEDRGSEYENQMWAKGVGMVESRESRDWAYGMREQSLQSYTVKQPDRPAITDEPADTTITAGESAVLTVAAGGTAPLAFQWYEGECGDVSRPLAGATEASFTTSPLTLSERYWVRVSNRTSFADSRTALVSIDDGRRSFTQWIAGSDAPVDQRGELATPANDGVSNLMKYALGVLPLDSAATHLPTPALFQETGQPAALALTFAKNSKAQGIRFALEMSADLLTWAEVESTTDDLGTNSDGTLLVRLRETVPPDGAVRRFARLKVVMTAP